MTDDKKRDYIEECLPAVRVLCSRLDLPIDEVSKSNTSTDEYVDVSFNYKGSKYWFNLEMFTRDDKVESGLDIKCEDSPRIHSFSTIGRYSYIGERWVDYCVSKFLKMKGTLEYYVAPFNFHISGDYGISNNGANSLIRDTRGILAKEPKKLYFLKVMHIRDDDHYRAFSYGIFDFSNNQWLIYPFCGSLDSGGGKGAHAIISKFLDTVKDECEFKSIELTVHIDEFNKFFRIGKHNLKLHLDNLERLSNFKKLGESCFELIDAGNYLEALRKMRTLADSLCTQLCKKLESDYKAKKDTLCKTLEGFCKNSALDNGILPSIKFFLSVANAAIHKEDEIFWDAFPAIDFMDRDDFILSAVICGKLLIVQLDNAITPLEDIFD